MPGVPLQRHPLTIRPDWPFNISRSPFFYGWVIWLLSTVGFILSVPGQTMGMAVFTDTFLEVLGLTRTQLASAYFFGTVTSALLLPRAGRYYDRLGARTMIVGSSVVLGLVVLYISVVDKISGALVGLTSLPLVWISFPLILLGYFGVRVSGQGVLTSASRNVLLVWFERRRGFVSGLRGIFVSLSFSIAPLVIAWMILTLGWRGALWAMAIIVGGLFASLALIFLRDDPETCGTHADGKPLADGEEVSKATGADRTIEETRRNPVFWIYSAPLAMHGLFGTAVTFHVVSIFEEAGRTSTEAFAYFLPQAVVALSVNLLVSWLSDSRPLKPFLILMLCLFLAGAYGLLNLDTAWGYWLLVVGFGGGGGLWGVMTNLSFIRFFGRKALGEISGLNASFMVFGSAVGPLLFSYARDISGSYRLAEIICVVMMVGLLIGAIVIKQDDPLDKKM